MMRGSGYSQSRLAKAAGVEVAVQQRNEKWHAAVARSAFSSQNAQNTACSDDFLKFRCRKIVRRCGAKRIFKSKCTKHLRGGPLFEVQMSKSGNPSVRNPPVRNPPRNRCYSPGAFCMEKIFRAPAIFPNVTKHCACHEK